MTVHVESGIGLRVYWARCAEARLAHELRYMELGDSPSYGAEKRARAASSEAERQWLHVASLLLAWGLS